MHIKYCSITGADDAVDPQNLVDLSKEFPFAEWAILLLPARAGTPRFPTLAWIKKFSGLAGNLNTAMHLCDAALLGFINGDAGIFAAMAGFKRIQLNLKFGEVEGKYDPDELVKRVRDNPQWQFIVQYGKEKKGLLPLFRGIQNHAVLFDESAGRGISPDSWDAPLPGHFCGYAGGLRPDNVVANLETIAKVAPNYETWIDMETGVRTDDKFDLAKVRKVLELSKPYVRKAAA
jgi:phosphoribosylanthranilate isomerase